MGLWCIAFSYAHFSLYLCISIGQNSKWCRFTQFQILELAAIFVRSLLRVRMNISLRRIRFFFSLSKVWLVVKLLLLSMKVWGTFCRNGYPFRGKKNWYSSFNHVIQWQPKQTRIVITQIPVIAGLAMQCDWMSTGVEDLKNLKEIFVLRFWTRRISMTERFLKFWSKFAFRKRSKSKSTPNIIQSISSRSSKLCGMKQMTKQRKKPPRLTTIV